MTDLELGYYDHDGHGLAYFDLISVPEALDAVRTESFNHIEISLTATGFAE